MRKTDNPFHEQLYESVHVIIQDKHLEREEKKMKIKELWG